jgi:hypothetical protein
MAGKDDRGWIKAIGRQLREDLGDAPTLPKEMLDLLDRMKSTVSERKDPKAARRRREN